MGDFVYPRHGCIQELASSLREVMRGVDAEGSSLDCQVHPTSTRGGG